MRSDDDEAPPENDNDVDREIDPRRIRALRTSEDTHYWYIEGPDNILRPIPAHDVRHMRRNGVLPVLNFRVNEEDENATEELEEANEPRPRDSTPVHVRTENRPATEEAWVTRWGTAMAAVRSTETLTSQERAFMYTQTFGQPPFTVTPMENPPATALAGADELETPPTPQTPTTPPTSRYTRTPSPTTRTSIRFSSPPRRAQRPRGSSRSVLGSAERPVRNIANTLNDVPVSPADTLTTSALFKERSIRIKAPIKKIMEIADELQHDIKEDIYLRIANASKEVFTTIEELDPTTKEDYQHDDVDYVSSHQTALEQLVVNLEVHERALNAQIDYLKEEREQQNVILQEKDSRISFLETQERTLVAQLDYLEKERENKYVSMHEKDNQINVLESALCETQKDVAACETVIVQQAAHPMIAPHIAHLRAMEAIRAGIDFDARPNPKFFDSKFMRMRIVHESTCHRVWSLQQPPRY
jgi:hypothetical protein